MPKAFLGLEALAADVADGLVDLLGLRVAGDRAGLAAGADHEHGGRLEDLHAARDGLVAADVVDRHRAGDDLAAVQVDRAQAAAGRAIVGGVLVPEEDDDDLAGVDRREQRARRVAGRGVVGEAGWRPA